MGAREMHGITADGVRDHSQQTFADYQEIMADVFAELAMATLRFGPMRSMHEGWAILREEVDELWDDVKANNAEAAVGEAKQVAAMALRFIHDVQDLQATKATPAVHLDQKAGE